MSEGPPFLTARNLFSKHYLADVLPQTEEWTRLDRDQLTETLSGIQDLFERYEGQFEQWNEAQLEDRLIKPVLELLGHHFEVQEAVDYGKMVPDYAFFETEAAREEAHQRKTEDAEFYQTAVAVGDAKRWGRKLDRQVDGSEVDVRNPSSQIDDYLRKTSAKWGILTNGQYWRLYWHKTSYKLDSYLEIDLPSLLSSISDDNLDAFKYFLLLFRKQAFIDDKTGECFLDRVQEQSNLFARELGETLQDNIYEANRILAEGLLDYEENDLDPEEDIQIIHDGALTFLYRLIFIFYAESEGRDLLPVENELYRNNFSLTELKKEIAEERDSGDPKYRNWQSNLWGRLERLFELIDKGSQQAGIPTEDLEIPAYNGGLFHTEAYPTSPPEATFLARHQIGDAYLAEVIDLLARQGNGGKKEFVDYSSLEIRHLGSIYEGLLEYKLNVASEPLVAIKKDGEEIWVPQRERDPDQAVITEIDAGTVYLTTGSGERKVTGSFYTPEYVVQHIVKTTLKPLIEEIKEDLVTGGEYIQDYGEEFTEQVLNLRILDPAMGSGHFLVDVVDYLAREIVRAYERDGEDRNLEDLGTEHDIHWARRQVAQRCIHGVDVNSMAVELAKTSVWLRTLASRRPLAFLDHHLKCGNSLIGTDLSDIEALASEAQENGGSTTLHDFGLVHKGTIEHLMSLHEDLIQIENVDHDDAMEMEETYHRIQTNRLRHRLLAIANVHTAEAFGVDVPDQAYEEMVSALESEDWSHITEKPWFGQAQELANSYNFFHWRLEFPQAFYREDGREKEDPGFDVVLGNPPYVKIQNISGDLRSYFSDQYDVATARFDLYGLFTERGYELTNSKFGYILPSKFFESQAGKGLRTYLTEKGAIDSILSFEEYQVFPDVTTYTCLLFLTKPTQDEIQIWKAIDQTAEYEITEENFDGFTIPTDELGAEKWRLPNPVAREIVEKVSNPEETLQDHVESVYVGVQTSGNKIFYFEPSRVGPEIAEGVNGYGHEVKVDRDLVHPMLLGKDISRYEPLEKVRYAIYPYERDGDSVQLIPEGELGRSYPRTLGYLNKYREELEDRGSEDQVFEGWYAHWCPRNFERRDAEKLVTPDISITGQFSYDPSGEFFFSNSAYGLVLTEDTELTYPALMGLLNSKIVTFFLQETAPTLRGGYHRNNSQYLYPIGVPVADWEELGRISEEIFERKGEMQAEIRSFTRWIESEWGCELDDLSLKTYFEDYWARSFDDMLRVAKKNRNLIEGDPSERDFQDKYRKEWKTSVDTIEPVLREIRGLEEEVDEVVAEVYGLDQEAVKFVESEVDSED